MGLGRALRVKRTRRGAVAPGARASLCHSCWAGPKPAEEEGGLGRLGAWLGQIRNWAPVQLLLLYVHASRRIQGTSTGPCTGACQPAACGWVWPSKAVRAVVFRSWSMADTEDS